MTESTKVERLFSVTSSENAGIVINKAKLFMLSETDNTNPLFLVLSLANNEVLTGEATPNATPINNKQIQSPTKGNFPVINNTKATNIPNKIRISLAASCSLYFAIFATKALPMNKPIPNNPIMIPISAVSNAVLCLIISPDNKKILTETPFHNPFLMTL